jgi:predicted ribosome quality control (RQC) complex YloA/Tae2 family protein
MPRKVVFDDIVYYIGKDAKDNWDLIQNADETDIWIHLQDHPSPHVIIENSTDMKHGVKHIMFGCQLCKQYSKLKTKKSVSISVLEMKFVKKGKSVGEAKLLRPPHTMRC